jgi:hypothetical protein
MDKNVEIKAFSSFVVFSLFRIECLDVDLLTSENIKSLLYVYMPTKDVIDCSREITYWNSIGSHSV